MSSFERIVAVCCLLPIAGCGFQLRGAPTAPPEMARTYIQAADRHSLFYRKLRRELRAAGVDVVESPANASAVFSVVSDITDQRVLSVSARNVPREYEVYYTIAYAVQNNGTTMLERQEQTVTRDYTWDERFVLGKSQEEDLLRESIAEDLVRIVMIQLSAL